MTPSPWRAAAPAAVAAEHAGFAPVAFDSRATDRSDLTRSMAIAVPGDPTVLASQARDRAADSRGRFMLGQASQVNGHDERRYGISWSAPAPQLADYNGVSRAIWPPWGTGERRDYRSSQYRLTCMTPDFSRALTGLPMIPVTVAAVVAAMRRMAGRWADGVRLHALCFRRHLKQVCLAAAEGGKRRDGRQHETCDLHGGGFVVAGADDASVTVAGRWADIPAAINEHCGGLPVSFDLTLRPGTLLGLAHEILADLDRIPHRFTDFCKNWSAA